VALVAQDSFTDTNGTNLTAHTRDDAGTWAKMAGVTADINIDTNRVYAGATTAHYVASGTPSSAEYDIEFDLTYLTNVADAAGVFARCNAGNSNDFYLARLAGTAGAAPTAIQVVKLVGGAGTVIASFTDTAPSVGVPRSYKFEVRDATKKMYRDGVELCSSTDNVITQVGVHGLRLLGAGSSSGLVMDNYEVNDLAAGGTTVNATTGVATAAGNTPTVTAQHEATQGAATAAGLTATSGAHIDATQGTATAAGNDATATATHTATQGAATAAGLDATGNATHTATQGSATAAGNDASATVRHDATCGAATASGLTAQIGDVAVDATCGTATADGLSASVAAIHVATIGAATAAGMQAAALVTHQATCGAATAAGLPATFGGPAGPDSPITGYPLRVSGTIRVTTTAGVEYLTAVEGAGYSSTTIGSERSTETSRERESTTTAVLVRSSRISGSDRTTDTDEV
jgi:hypothetical protein